MTSALDLVLTELSTCAWLKQGSQDQASGGCFQRHFQLSFLGSAFPGWSYVFFPMQSKEGVKLSLPFQDQDKTVTWLEREQDPAPFSPSSTPFLLPPCFSPAHPTAKLLQVLDDEL